jgi:hypothetical protein
MGIKTDGTLWTWGDNTSGALGSGTTVDRCSPGTVAGGGTTWYKASSGNFFAMSALKTDGTLWSWGDNNRGGLGVGLGITVDRCSPGSIPIQAADTAEDLLLYATAVSDLTDNREVSVKSTSHLPVSDASSEVSTGQIVFVDNVGIPLVKSTDDFGDYPAWRGLDNAMCCRIEPDGPKGSIWTWGFGYMLGQAYGTITNQYSPGTIVGGCSGWKNIGIGHRTVLGIRDNGTLWTWGSNDGGLLGINLDYPQLNNRCSPGTVAGGGTNWCQATQSYWISASAIKTDGTLWTWGLNQSGELGDGTTLNRSSPGTVAGGIGPGCLWCRVQMGFTESVGL